MWTSVSLLHVNMGESVRILSTLINVFVLMALQVGDTSCLFFLFHVELKHLELLFLHEYQGKRLFTVVAVVYVNFQSVAVIQTKSMTTT